MDGRREKGNPVARRARKATGLSEVAGPTNGEGSPRAPLQKKGRRLGVEPKQPQRCTVSERLV